jgi:NADPH:quinone reductase-like Zn-dependent oxidoreductase
MCCSAHILSCPSTPASDSPSGEPVVDPDRDRGSDGPRQHAVALEAAQRLGQHLLADAASLPLNALTARQALDLLGPAEGRTLLVTGGAGALGGHAIVLASRAGWRVTALARDADAEFLARAGAEPVAELAGPSFDAVLDAAVLLESALAAVRDGGSFVGVASGSLVAAERGVTVHTVSVQPDSEAIAGLLGLAAEGTLELRVAGRVPLRDAAKAFEKVAGGGQRGRWLLIP